MKKVLMSLFVLSLFVFISSGVFAARIPVFTIVDKNSCNDNNEVLRLSDLTNAHGEVLNGAGNYPYALCSDYVANQVCDAGEKPIIQLSSSTNAHAEVPDISPSQYTTTPVCYGDLDCVSTSDTCGTNDNSADGKDATTYPISILSLSSSSNAHIGPSSAYTTKICCTSVTYVTSAFWSKNEAGSIKINDLNVVPGKTQIYLVISNVESARDADIRFEILERDAFINDKIKTITSATVGGKASEIWTITKEDLSKTKDFNEFFFKVYSESSSTQVITSYGSLKMNIQDPSICEGKNLCSDYKDKSSCDNYNTCSGVAENSRVSTQIDCSDPLTTCFCEWNSTRGACSGASKITTVNLAGEVTGSGNCVTIPDSSDPNGCSDGFISYSWTATWTGTGKRPLDSCPLTGSQSIACPAQVQLPFFDGIHFLITILIISAIYAIMILKHKKTHRKKK